VTARGGGSPKEREGFFAMNIDAHHHVVAPVLKAKAADHIRRSAGLADQVLAWTPEESLAKLDEAGVDRAVVMSSTATGIARIFSDPAAICRECNEYSASLASDYKGRFIPLALLPYPDMDATLAAIADCMDSMGMPGVLMSTSYDGGLWQGDERLTPIYEELDRRGAVAFCHPRTPEACADLIPAIHNNTLEFLFDTARAITALAFTGTLQKFPRIKFVFCHSGGALPPLFNRISRSVERNPKLKQFMPDGFKGAVGKLYYDTAMSTAKGNFGAMKDLAPISQFMFGSDYPYMDPIGTMRGLPDHGLSEAELAAVKGGNAARVFGVKQ
jgi:predicted TIM-barrel fold metal-dependent hydrolase